MKNINYIVLDVETGGFYADKNPITQFAGLIMDSAKFVTLREYQTYVKPYANLTITEEALSATMVSMRDVLNGIDHRILVKKLIEFFKQANPTGKKATRAIVIGHNPEFDFGFLEFLFVLEGKNLYDYVRKVPIDTVYLAKQAWDAEIKNSDANNSYKLSSCCSRAGILLNDAHGAMNDTIATKELFIYFTKRLRRTPSSSKSEGEAQETTKQRNFFAMG